MLTAFTLNFPQLESLNHFHTVFIRHGFIPELRARFDRFQKVLVELNAEVSQSPQTIEAAYSFILFFLFHDVIKIQCMQHTR